MDGLRLFWLIFVHFEPIIVSIRLTVVHQVLVPNIVNEFNVFCSQILFCELVELMLCKRSVKLNSLVLFASSCTYVCHLALDISVGIGY